MRPDALLAHGYPYEPVEIRLSLYPDRILATINSNKCFWSGDVIQADLPPPVWTDAMCARIKKYVDDHFQMSVDGAPLRSRLLSERYVQEPFQDILTARVIFELEYPLPASGGKKLTGHVDFFKEEWEEHYLPLGISTAAAAIPQHFVSRLRVDGREVKHITVPLNAPDFQFSLTDMVRTPWQARRDAAWEYVKHQGSRLATPFLVLLFLSVVVRYRSRF